MTFRLCHWPSFNWILMEKLSFFFFLAVKCIFPSAVNSLSCSPFQMVRNQLIYEHMQCIKTDTKLDKCSNHSNLNNKYPIKSVQNYNECDWSDCNRFRSFCEHWIVCGQCHCCALLPWHINRLCINWFDISMQPNSINSLTYYRESCRVCCVWLCDVADEAHFYSIRIDITFLFDQIISKAHKRRIAFAFWTKLCCFGYVPCSTFSIYLPITHTCIDIII